MKHTGKRLRALALAAAMVLLMTGIAAGRIQGTLAAPAAAQSTPTLQQMYGTLGQYTKGPEAIKARISGNTLTIDVYVNFTGSYNAKIDGQTYAALAKKGIRLWAGSYTGSRWDFRPGMGFSVRVNVMDIYNGAGRLPGQNYFDFVCRTDLGRSYVNYSTGFYNRELLGTGQGAIVNRGYTNGAVVMYNGLSKRYTANQYAKVSAHEFGHVLGLGDLYKRGIASTPECPQGKFYAEGDIMATQGRVTPNNIEMFLEAYRTGWYQAYLNSGYEVKSKAIKSY